MSSRHSRRAAVGHQRSQRPGDPAGVREAGPVGVGDHRLDHRGAGPAVRAGAQRGGVRLDHRAGALAVDDLHGHRARVRAGERGPHRHPEPATDGEGDLDQEPVLGGRAVQRRGAEHAQRGERVRVQPGAVPRVEPVGQHVLRLAAADHGGHRGAGCGRGPGAGPSTAAGRSPAHRPRPAAPRPARRRRGSGRCASRAARRRRAPARASGRPAARRAPGRRTARRPGAGRPPGRRAARRRSSRQATSSRPADHPAERPAGPDLPAAGQHEPAAGRPGLRPGAAPPG